MVLDNLPDCRAEYRISDDGFDADVYNAESESEWAVIWVNYARQPKDQPLDRVWFHRGSEEMVFRIVAGLAKICGPFAVAKPGRLAPGRRIGRLGLFDGPRQTCGRDTCLDQVPP